MQITLRDCRIYLHATDQSQCIKQLECIIIYLIKLLFSIHSVSDKMLVMNRIAMLDYIFYMTFG